MSLSKALNYLTNIDLKFNVYSEFTSKRDLSYYVILILMIQGDYDTFKSQLARKNIKKIALFSDRGRAIVNFVIRNDFKSARLELLKIFNYLTNDPYMAENLSTIRKRVLTSFAKMFLNAYTRVKISAIADCLVLKESRCKSFLESEISSLRLNFKIDEDSQCLIKNSNQLSYLDVLARATNMINHKNENMADLILNQNIENDVGAGNL
jgi:hypothetical protein